MWQPFVASLYYHCVAIATFLQRIDEKEKAKFFGPSARYTTGNAVEQMKVLFATYPRSGNSMMRKYFENISGLVTGTDNDVNHPPVIALQFSLHRTCCNVV